MRDIGRAYLVERVVAASNLADIITHRLLMDAFPPFSAPLPVFATAVLAPAASHAYPS